MSTSPSVTDSNMNVPLVNSHFTSNPAGAVALTVAEVVRAVVVLLVLLVVVVLVVVVVVGVGGA